MKLYHQWSLWMPRYAIMHFLVLPILFDIPGIYAINLKDSLKLVRQENLELAELKAQKNQAIAKAKKTDAAYDSQLGWTSYRISDRSKSQSNVYESLSGTSHELYWQKFTGLGSSIKIGLGYQNSQPKFPPPSPPITISPGVEINPYDPASSFPINPEHRSQISIEFSQPLWRNWLSKELDLQKLILQGAAIPPKYHSLIKEQQIQGETELLFVKLAQLREQERLSKEMTRLSEKFYQLMSKRDTYGRAEQLDVAEAKSQVVKVGGQLLQIKLAIKNLEKQLTFRVYQKSRPKRIYFETFPLSRPAIPIPATNPQKLIQLALKNRLDLAMLKDSKEPLRAQLDLAKEQNAMNIDFFGTATVNGLEEDDNEAFAELKHPKYTVGLKLAFPLGQSSFRADKEQVLAGLSEIDHKEIASTHYIKRDIEIAWLELDAADQLYKQAKYHEESLSALIREERKRISQARSDEIATIRYQIDMLSARIDATAALAKARESEARIRLICHAYDSEKTP